MNTQPVRFYGLALAALPDEQHKSVLKISCSPVSASNDKFDELTNEDGAFEIEIDITDTKALMDGVLKFVPLLESLVKRQIENTAGGTFRDVSLRIGDSLLNPINPIVLGVICDALFGVDYRLRTWLALQSQIDAIDACELTLIEKIDANEKSGEPAEPIEAMRAKLIDGSFYLIPLAEKHAPDTPDRNGHDAKPTPEQAVVFEKFPGYEEIYKEACRKLAGLLGCCTLDWVQFSVLGETNAEDLPPQSPLDLQLIELREDFESGKEGAREKICDLARQEGVSRAKRVNINPYIFALAANKKKRKAPDSQKLYPSEYFYAWDPAFRAAFHSGFVAEIDSRYRHRRIMLPTDPHTRPFVYPVFLAIRAQLLHWEKPDDPPHIDDKSAWRQKIAAYARTMGRKPLRPALPAPKYPASQPA